MIQREATDRQKERKIDREKLESDLISQREAMPNRAAAAHAVASSPHPPS